MLISIETNITCDFPGGGGGGGGLDSLFHLLDLHIGLHIPLYGHLIMCAVSRCTEHFRCNPTRHKLVFDKLKKNLELLCLLFESKRSLVQSLLDDMIFCTTNVIEP